MGREPSTAHHHAPRPRNPLRTASGLLSPNAIEYAAQAMALHGGLIAQEGSEPSAGFLASARNVRLAVQRLDEVEGAASCMRSAPRATRARSSTNSR